MKPLARAQQATLFSGQAGSPPAAGGSTRSGSEHGPNLGLNSHTKHDYSSTVNPALNCFRERPRPWKMSLNTESGGSDQESNQDFPDVKLALIFLKRHSFTPTCSVAATFQRQGNKSDWTAIRHYPSQTVMPLGHLKKYFICLCAQAFRKLWQEQYFSAIIYWGCSGLILPLTALCFTPPFCLILASSQDNSGRKSLSIR